MNPYQTEIDLSLRIYEEDARSGDNCSSRLANNGGILRIPVFQGVIVGDGLGVGRRCGIGDFCDGLGKMGIGIGGFVMSNG